MAVGTTVALVSFIFALLLGFLGLMEVIHQGQCRAEGHMLELPRQAHEGLGVAAACAGDLLLLIQFPVPHTSKVPGNGCCL
jgi:hypothetical protein